MKDNSFEFEMKGSYYTTAEKESLATRDLENASETCRPRHSLPGINQAFRRSGDQRIGANGIPRTLDRLCLKLRIRWLKESTPACAKGSRARNFQNEIVSFLASLPNAMNYREENWLDTPELWPFVDLEQIHDINGENCENLKEELRWRMDNWCDRWIPYASTSLPGMKTSPEHIYLFPFWEDLKSKSLPRSRKKFLGNNTFLALSQARTRKEPVSVSESVRERVIKLGGKMSIGYTSFKCGVTVADVIEILNENRDQFQNNL